MYNNRRSGRAMFSNSGWLFADMFLALMIIFIVASTVGKDTPSPTPVTPTPTPTPAPQVLDRQALAFTLNVDPLQLNQPNTVTYVQDQVNQQLNASNDANRKVGFVITLAGGPSGDNHAQSFNSILVSMPAFQNALFKNYHDLGNLDSEFDLEIYFLG